MKNRLLDCQGGAHARRQLSHAEPELVYLHRILLLDTVDLEEGLEARCNAASGVQSEEGEHFKHVNVEALGEPLEVVELDLLVHVCGQDALLEVLRRHKNGPSISVPAFQHLPHHLAVNVRCLHRICKHKRVRL